MIPSAKQQKIYDTWVNEDCNILVQAVAGSGKTTCILKLIDFSNSYKCLYLAFNKTIQEELEDKIKQNNMTHCSALTLHSLGLSLIKNIKSTEINDGKVYDMIYKVINENKYLYKLDNTERNELDFVRYALIDFNNISRLYLTNDFFEIIHWGTLMGRSFTYKLLTPLENSRLINRIQNKGVYKSYDEIISSPEYIEEYKKINNERFIKLWNRLYEIREESYKEKKIVVDFLDMIYLPVTKPVNIPTYYDYLFIDECQDLNFLQHKLINKLILQGKIIKFCAVGDVRQSIYLFSGAFSKSFELFKERPNTIELPLDINYRCATDIINTANEIYNNLIPFKDNKGKVLVYNQENETKKDSNEYTLTDILEDIVDNCLIICRNTKPLIEIYFDLIGIGKKPSFIGNDILSSITSFLKPYKKDTILQFKEVASEEYKLLSSKKDNSDIDRVNFIVFKENYNLFSTIEKRLQYTEHQEINYIIDDLKSKLTSKGDIKLCTIHKSKGLEHDTVYILNEFLIPSKYAMLEEQLIQENNLKYVARTRAKENLIFLNLKEEKEN